MELSAVQHILPKKELHQSGVGCLNLNIIVLSGTTVSSKLPVFVFIHGGGYLLGAGSWSTYDFTRFVRLSAEKKLPIVAVSFKLAGLLHCFVLNTITDSIKLPVGSFWVLGVG